MRRPRALHSCGIIAALCLLLSTAAHSFTATADLREPGRTVTGHLDCAAGGDVAGEALLTLVTDTQTGPLQRSGGRAAGRYDLRLIFSGSARPSSPSSLTGSVDVSGIFTFADGRTALVMGTCAFSGSGSVAAGSVRLEASWRVTCPGDRLVSPQELRLALPPFTLQGAAAPASPAEPGAGGAATSPTPPGQTPTAATPQQVTLPTGLPLQLPAAPVPPGAPAARGGALDQPLLNALVGGQQTANGRSVIPAAALPAATKAVHAYLEVKAPLPDGQLLVTLYQGPKIKEKHLIAAGSGDRFIITFYPTNKDVFPAGNWSLLLQSGGRDLGCVPFSVGP